MRLAVVYVVCALALPRWGAAQPQSCSLSIVAQLVDSGLNLRPVPKAKLVVRADPDGAAVPLTVGFDGTAETNLACGTYMVTSESPVEFDGKQYRWSQKVILTAGTPSRLELSNDNAEVRVQTQLGESAAGRVQDGLTPLFKKLENSVVTVWSEFGHGTGFLADESGLVVTNQHVVGPSEYIAVQIDEEHKVRATLLASDPEKDVAVLWVNVGVLPGAVAAPLGKSSAREPLAVEGERVFTIGSPLNQRKILTTGIVSKLEARAILSDININQGNSGGPLFNSLGKVIGIVTFRDPGDGGSGVAGIVRIEQIDGMLEAARSKVRGMSPPAGTPLPVEPRETFPLDAIKRAATSGFFDLRPYMFSQGNFDVAIMTPVVKYHFGMRPQIEAAREKAKRTQDSQTAVKGTFRPLDDLKNWAEYIGEYQPVIQIRAMPRLRETLGSALLRGLTAQNGVSTIPAKMRYKTDFYRMRLRCGDKEVEPIHPGKVAHIVDVKNYFVNATDATYEGIYTYPAEAISGSCGQVTLEIYSEKTPNAAVKKVLDKKTVERVSMDFGPYRVALRKDAAPSDAAPETAADPQTANLGQASRQTTKTDRLSHQAVPVSTDAAYEALRARDYASAIEGFRQALDTSPSNAAIRKDLAYTYLKIGENALALAEFRQAMGADPKDLDVALEFAFLCHEASGPGGCPNQARGIFDRVRKSGVAPYAATAEQAFQNIDGPLAEGIERWKKAIGMGANDFSAHFELASLAEKRGDLGLAAEHYEKAWRVLPDRRSVLVDLGRVWKGLERSEDATAALLAASRGGEPRAAEGARELLPDRYPYVNEFRGALALDPQNADLRRELAYLFISMGRQPAAEAEFRILTEKAPDDLLSAAQLAFLLHGRGEQAAAKPLFDKVLAGADEDLANRVRAVLHEPQVVLRGERQQPIAPTAKVMADRSIQAGYLKDAAKYLETAAEADPNDEAVKLRLGWTYNNLHQDVDAVRWFDRARKSSDPAIAAEAQKAWRGLRSSTARVRTTGWMFPLFSTRWHDAFGYGQVKMEVRTWLGIRPYLSARIIGDTRQIERAAMGPQYLSESSVIVGGGLITTPWRGLTAWAEAGRSVNYLNHQKLSDYRGGVSHAYGTGHTLRGESPGWFASTSTDAVFLSRFGNDVLVYNQERIGYTAGPTAFRAQVAALVGVTVDEKSQYWANYGEAGIGLRFSSSFLPASMYFAFDAVRGVYLVNVGNPRGPNFYDFRAGLWYAFTR